MKIWEFLVESFCPVLRYFCACLFLHPSTYSQAVTPFPREIDDYLKENNAESSGGEQ